MKDITLTIKYFLILLITSHPISIKFAYCHICMLHFRYTGHCPDLHEHIGMTYPWATHAVLEEKPNCAGRLSPMRAPVRRTRVFPAPGPRNVLTTNQGVEDDRIIRQRRAAQKYPILGTDIAVGYRGNFLFFA